MNNFKTTKKIVPIDHVTPNPWNPNVQSDIIFRKEVESIKELGMLGSILVRDSAGQYEILDGEHRWKACKELGYTEIAVETLGEIPDEEAKLLTILLNNLRGKDDILKRAAILDQLSQGQLQLLPFTEQEIEHTKSLLNFDFSQYDKEEEIPDKPKIKTLMFALDEDQEKLWEMTREWGAKDGWKSEERVFLGLMEDYLSLRVRKF